MTSTPGAGRSTSPSSVAAEPAEPLRHACGRVVGGATPGRRALAVLCRAIEVADRLAAALLLAGGAYVGLSLLNRAWRDSAWWLLIAVPVLVTVPLLAYQFRRNPALGGRPAAGRRAPRSGS